MKIYCDESGFTGEHLLDESQPYFVYSGANLNSDIANEIRHYIINSHNFQGNEIKGKNLVKSLEGQKVIKYIFEKYASNVRIVFHDKKFALAGMIVEYGIEPYLKSNKLFYESKFHLYLTSGFYLSLMSKKESAEILFEDFSNIARGKVRFEDSLFFNSNVETSLLSWLFDIISSNPEIMLNELNHRDWTLDLTMTSLFGILNEWSKNGEKLEVICDNSKVFKDNSMIDSYNSMGMGNKRATFMGTPIGFGLDKVIITSDSKETVELQIADLFSSTVYYCLNNRGTEFSNEILKIVLKDCRCTPESYCIMPTIEEDLEEIKDRIEFYNEFMKVIHFDVLSRKQN